MRSATTAGPKKADDDSVIKSGPYAGAAKGAGSRFDYFYRNTPLANFSSR